MLELFGQPVESYGGQLQATPYNQFGAGGGAFSPSSFAALPGLLQNLPLNATEQALTGGGIQSLGFLQGLQGQGLLEQAGAALGGMFDPQAQIALARRGFEQETLPTILERAPGFSSSDLQRELTKGGVDLETQIAALTQQSGLQAAALAPQLAAAIGTNLFDQASAALGYGQLGRDFIREQSPSGDAFRTLAALQSLTTPALTTFGKGSQSSKGGGFWG
jgi:hypothetical protein